MARGPAAQRRAGGGDGIQALRQAGPRLALGLFSALAFAGVAAYALSRAGELAGVVGVIVGLGALLLVLVLWRGFLDLLPWALATVGGAYAATLFLDHHRVDGASTLVGAGLLLCGELAAWSLDARWRISADAAVLRRRTLALGALVLAGLVASGLAVALSGVAGQEGLLLTTLGAGAAVAAVGLSVGLLLRGR